MKNLVSKVLPNSIAEEVEIESGDKLVSINGNNVKDIIDYKFLITDEYLELEVEKPNGEIWEIEIEKDYDEDLGIIFKEAILDRPMSCHNKCVFCFIDQLPTGMRQTLYFKDDDSRLSFLQGNFLTLTNMKEEDIERIIKYRISPINVSVHTTNPELRIKMLNNRFAGNIYDILKRLAEADIKVNTQVVCCPGINDGEELIRTIEDLYVLYPSVENLAVVPLGITKFRANLPHLKLFTKEKSKELIESVKILQDKYVKENGTPFVRLSDEFYVMAGSEPPTEEHYGGYEQLEDGIGMIRILKNTIKEQVEYLNKKAKGNFTIITGASAKTVLEEVANSIMKVNSNIKINVIAVENKFFGTTITVAGLLTGIDIINTAKEETLGDYIIIPNNMLKKGYELGEEVEGLLLDDYTVRDLEKILNKKFLVCDYAGDDLINILNKHLEEE
ncbi:PDZ domain family protein [Clostridium argentinense CDC 2741]|uniref:PDZ domain family protein n=1 Tax=Clostridium argentinense CDC 2741 TaxID=1418104 RepID=A0A0C1RAQ5_9CLOT|nr:radical SAM protein [Clostridium argentinense]ARC84652.1 radical SAM protein [Clostridium argentinense]KIE47491.1 PDZ domain family protein [Clostridium argentinense CDC 2741]NFF40160.1 radical SAM protein [Clostridium argentinense]NFP50637.1 radical SAM protein [Clostridium argentinense]NFP72415.1 radical SAM protein [Clostridium argentinense]